MSSSNSRIRSGPVLVADASVVINLNATTQAERILRALPHPVAVTENALQELRSGSRNGHRDGDLLEALIGSGAVSLARMTATDIYEQLITGSAGRTLDDGESATISYAREIGGIALIDERKARSLCAGRFPDLQLWATADILLHDTVADALGREMQAECLLNALKKARMRVLEAHLAQVIALIGKDAAASCASLPQRLRVSS